jgi:hypothetical protein
MSMTNYDGVEVKLVRIDTGAEVSIGDPVVTSRGVEDVVRGIYPPHKPSSSGKVNMYYASVYGLEFREV